jgi:hypothetical protein
MTPDLVAVILTLNEEHHIQDCLESLSWTDQQIVFDSFSSDRTLTLAQEAGAHVMQHRFENYAQQRNAAINRVQAGWIFFVDADERATPALAAEVRNVIQNRPEVGWSVPRHNYIFGHLTRSCGWYPDYQFRLFRRGHARWERPVHEVARVDGPHAQLKNPLIHYNYEDVTDFRARQERYAAFDAAILHGQGVRPKVYTPYTQALRQFWWRFVTLRGIQEGLHGLRLSLLMAYYEMRKYQRLSQLPDSP